MSQTVYVLTEGDDVHWVTSSDAIRDRWWAQGDNYGGDAYVLDDPDFELLEPETGEKVAPTETA